MKHIRGPADLAAAFGVSRETTVKLETYAALLAKWQRAVNLVAPSTIPDVWHRHFADSAQLLAHVPDPATASGAWVDLGSGAGFPGLVLAILLAGRSPVRITLIESDQRKAAFLREVARGTGVAVDILCERIGKSATQDMLRPAAVVTARALASLDALLGLALPFCGPETRCLFLKGRRSGEELVEARRHWMFEASEFQSVTDPEGRILVVRRISELSEGTKP